MVFTTMVMTMMLKVWTSKSARAKFKIQTNNSLVEQPVAKIQLANQQIVLT